MLAFVAAADFFVGSYCLVLDEIVKDRRLVRTKPYQMDLDDALALTDDDALARDMFARSSNRDGKSFYMEVSQPWSAQLCRDQSIQALIFVFAKCSLSRDRSQILIINMQHVQESSSPHAQVQLHDVKVEGQWRRVKEDMYNPVPVSALPSGPIYGQTK